MYRKPMNVFFTVVAWHLYNLLTEERKTAFWEWFNNGRSQLCILPYHLEKFKTGFNTSAVMNEPTLNEHRQAACKVVQDICNSHRLSYNDNGTVSYSDQDESLWWSTGGELVYRGQTVPFHVNIEMMDTVYRLCIPDNYVRRALRGDYTRNIPEPRGYQEYSKDRTSELAALMDKLEK